MTRRQFMGFSALGSLAALSGCRGGVPTILGYQLGNEALYDSNIKTIYVHSFYNRVIQTTPYRGFEADLTQYVVREIGAKTPFKIASDLQTADTELIGTIILFGKNIYNRTQQNTVREGELVVTVEVIWRDLRDGTILSSPRRRRTPGGPPIVDPNEPPPVPFDPTIPVAPPLRGDAPLPVPVRIVGTGRYIEELGETNATAAQRAQLRIATQIVSMMEKRW
jgi:hypothetical protein